MLILDDGVMRAEKYANWVLLRWLGEQNRRFHKRLVKDWKSIEDYIRQQRLAGWVVASEKRFTKMHGIFEKIGARKYAEDDEYVFFRKEMNYVR